MTTTTTRSAEQLIRKHLQQIAINFLVFEHLSITRNPGADPSDSTSFMVTAERQWVTETTPVFRVRADIDRGDLQIVAVAVVSYTVPDIEQLRADEEVERVFISKVVVPALYPYFRERAHQLSLDTGAAPLVLNILNPLEVNVSKLED